MNTAGVVRHLKLYQFLLDLQRDFTSLCRPGFVLMEDNTTPIDQFQALSSIAASMSTLIQCLILWKVVRNIQRPFSLTRYKTSISLDSGWLFISDVVFVVFLFPLVVNDAFFIASERSFQTRSFSLL